MSINKWNSFWMGMAKQASTLSKDPSTKVGAIIVTPDNRQCSIGYNGFPKGVDESSERWQRPIKYEYVVHAEENAIINAPFDTQGCDLYCTLQPCHKCMGKLVNAGIRDIFFLETYPNLKHPTVWLAMSGKFRNVVELNI